MTGMALSHLKVLELCNFVTGPYCTKLLADLGADVIKIELPDMGDDARHRGPFVGDVPHHERSGLFLYLNTNKRGITLNITTEAGKHVFKDLVRQVDVLVEDRPPGAMEELELGYSQLKKINPRLVMTSITPFGENGRYSHHKAYALNIFHAGGEGYLLPMQSNDLNREPLKGGGIQPDCICGLIAASGTLAATCNLFNTGEGQYVEVSKHDALMTMVLLEITMFVNHGILRSRLRRPLLMPVPMKCKNGYIQMSALTEREWNDVVEFMGNPSWADDERFSQWLNRHILGDEITPHVEEFVKNWNKDELFHKLQAKAIAAVPVSTSKDIMDSPQMDARGFFAEMDHSCAGKHKYPTAPYNISETPWKVRYAAPLLGEHNKAIYCEQLGYTEEYLVLLRQSGVI